MNEEIALLKAGRMASQVRDEAISLVEIGKPVIEICEYVRKRVKELGGRQAFPCNIGIDHIAAHYTSPIGDMTRIQDNSLVKVDIGVHVDGYIADTAKTVCLNPVLNGLVDAAEAGLEEAIKFVKSGVKTGNIGSIIERAIRNKGAIPIRNLTGHRMARYVVHAGQSIPNISVDGGDELQVGDVYAIEPFSVPANASGEVINGPKGHIYLFKKKRKVKGWTARHMIKYIQSQYRTLPFASRWVLMRFPGDERAKAFSELVNTRCVHSYPQLVERTHAPVAQAEHTVIITEDGCIVTTA